MPPHLANFFFFFFTFFFFLEMKFHRFGQAGLELLTSGDLPTSASHSALKSVEAYNFYRRLGKLWLILVNFNS